MTTQTSHPALRGAPDEVADQHTLHSTVWDLPIRLFHWALVLAVTTAIISGELGGEWMALHAKAGLTIVGLLAFRIVWGVAGSSTARFAQFAPTPGRLRAYLRGRWQGSGHNPLGALAVFALLGLLLAQAGTGLFSDNEIDFTGPLYGLVEPLTALKLTGWHQWLANVLLGLIALHVLAIAFYQLVRRKNLIKPMLTGRKASAQVAPFKPGSFVALVLAILVAGAAVLLANGAALNPAPANSSSPTASGPAAAPAAPGW